jgi:hypothetical protein
MANVSAGGKEKVVGKMSSEMSPIAEFLDQEVKVACTIETNDLMIYTEADVQASYAIS